MESAWRKTPHSKVRTNQQQTQPTYNTRLELNPGRSYQWEVCPSSNDYDIPTPLCVYNRSLIPILLRRESHILFLNTQQNDPWLSLQPGLLSSEANFSLMY